MIKELTAELNRDTVDFVGTTWMHGVSSEIVLELPRNLPIEIAETQLSSFVTTVKKAGGNYLSARNGIPNETGKVVIHCPITINNRDSAANMFSLHSVMVKFRASGSARIQELSISIGDNNVDSVSEPALNMTSSFIIHTLDSPKKIHGGVNITLGIDLPYLNQSSLLLVSAGVNIVRVMSNDLVYQA